MASFLERLYRRLGKRYFWLYVALDSVSAFFICLGTVGIFSLYEDMSAGEFWRVALFADACVAVALFYGFVREWRQAAPLVRWIEGDRSRERSLEAWRTAVSLP